MSEIGRLHGFEANETVRRRVGGSSRDRGVTAGKLGLGSPPTVRRSSIPKLETHGTRLFVYPSIRSLWRDCCRFERLSKMWVVVHGVPRETTMVLDRVGGGGNFYRNNNSPSILRSISIEIYKSYITVINCRSSISSIETTHEGNVLARDESVRLAIPIEQNLPPGNSPDFC